MRALPFLALPLLLLPVAGRAQSEWIESSTTVKLTLSFTSEVATAQASNGTSTVTTKMGRYRLGNSEILRAMVNDGLIESITGWKLVALWDEWDDGQSGNNVGYRFHARRGKGAATELVAVPEWILSYDAVLPVVSLKHTLNGQNIIVAGSEKFEVLQRLDFSVLGDDGYAEGIEKGGGTYKRSGDWIYYLPGSSKASLAGNYSDDGEYATGLVSGTVSFGAGKIVRLPTAQGSYASSASAIFDTGLHGSLTLGVVAAIGDEHTETLVGNVELARVTQPGGSVAPMFLAEQPSDNSRMQQWGDTQGALRE